MKESPPTEELLYGIHAIQERLLQQPDTIEEIWIAENAQGRLAHLAKEARKLGVMVRHKPRHVFDRQWPQANHQGAAAKIQSFSYRDIEIFFDDALAATGPLVFLVGVQDPGNVGAIFRSAQAFGAAGAILSKRDSCGVTAAVHKASAGAASHLPIAQSHQPQQTMRALQDAGWWLLGLDAKGTPIDQFDLKRPTVFLLGAEEKGLKPSLAKHCDAMLGIPMVHQWDSLNVSVSGGVALYEWRRQNGPLLSPLPTPPHGPS